VVNADTLNSDGTIVFPVQLREGDAYEVVVDETPRRFNCQVSAGQGAMPAGGLQLSQAVLVTCQQLNASPLEINMIGVPLTSSISITTHILSSDESNSAPLESINDVFTPSSVGGLEESNSVYQVAGVQLYHGDRYQVEITNLSPDTLDCEVRNSRDLGNLTFVYEDSQVITPVLIVCADSATNVESYSISGQVHGLTSGIVKLSLNSSTLYVRAEAHTGDRAGDPVDFTFDSVVQDSEYEVSVGVQPDGYRCEVSNGSGRINDSSITGVRVDCQASGTIEVIINSSSEGAPIIAKLFSRRRSDREAIFIGAADSGVTVRDGSARFAIADASGGSDPLQLGIETYDLFVFKCTTNQSDVATNRPIYTSNDHGYYRAVEVRLGETTRVTINEADFQSLRQVGVSGVVADEVNIHDPGQAAEAPMICTFSPAGSIGDVNGRKVVPVQTRDDAPIVGKAVRACTSNCSLDDRTYATNDPTYLPLPSGLRYDLSCYVDITDNNQRDVGDFFFTGQKSAGDLLGGTTVPLNLLREGE
jgi:hypothetical protein